MFHLTIALLEKYNDGITIYNIIIKEDLKNVVDRDTKDMDLYSFLVSVCLAIGLSAACGFRVFIPPLAYGIFYKAGLVGLSDSWLWIGNDWIIMLLTIAALVEVFSTFIPLLDNLLDIVATPFSILAGIILASSSLSEITPGLQWILSMICGLGITGSFQLSTVTIRGFSSLFTGGLGNPIFSFIEDLTAIFLSIIVILFPLLGLILIILMAIIFRKLILKLKSKKNQGKSDIKNNYS